MTSLEILGCLSDAETFTGTLDLAELARLPFGGPIEQDFVEENLAAARRAGRHDIGDVLERRRRRPGH